MTEKEILYQIIEREISNILGAINPSFRIFSDSLTSFAINFIDPYVDAFTKGSFPTAKINTTAARRICKK